MSYVFDSNTEKVLIAHGWHAERHVDVSKYKAAWKKEGYLVTPEVIRFAANLGGLNISHAAYRVEGGVDRSDFDPLNAISKLDCRWVLEDYEVIAKGKLCPVGLGFSSHMTYLVSDKGEMFGGYDNFFCLIGRTVETALNNIFFTHQFETLNE